MNVVDTPPNLCNNQIAQAMLFKEKYQGESFMSWLYQTVYFSYLNPFSMQTGTLANSEDPDEMPQKNAPFHQDVYCLQNKIDLQWKKYIIFFL